MKRRRLTLLSLAGMLILACSFPLVGSSAIIPTETAATTAVEAATAATDTPTTAPTATAIPSAGIPLASPSGLAVNCRSSPGLSWPVAVILQPRQTAEIIGKTIDGEWLQVKNPSLAGGVCWVAASVVTTTGNISGVPVVAVPPTPTQLPTSAVAFVTDVSVSVSPSKISVPGCMGPIPPSTATATIEVNGPMRLQWHFETDQNGTLPSRTLNFNKAGAKTVTQGFTPPLDPGKWRVELFIDGISLKGANAVAFYKIVC